MLRRTLSLLLVTALLWPAGLCNCRAGAAGCCPAAPVAVADDGHADDCCGDDCHPHTRGGPQAAAPTDAPKAPHPPGCPCARPADRAGPGRPVPPPAPEPSPVTRPLTVGPPPGESGPVILSVKHPSDPPPSLTLPAL